MKISLENKRALVGGSSKGLGFAVAKQLAISGAKVTLVARNIYALKDNVNELNELTNCQHEYLEVNYNNFEDYKEKIKKYIIGNPIDILINNTQGPKAGDVESVSLDDYQKSFDLLFKSVVFTTNLCLDHMKKNKWGRIINISSASASIGNRGQSNYAAAKAGVEAFTKSLAKEVGKRDITINAVAPGFISTDMTENNKGVNADYLAKEIPLGRFGKPEEVASLISFMCSDGASYITGQTIHINGGLYM